MLDPHPVPMPQYLVLGRGEKIHSRCKGRWGGGSFLVTASSCREGQSSLCPCTKQRSALPFRHQGNKRRSIPINQPPSFPRLELPGVNKETIIYKGVGQEIGHIQQRPGNTVPAQSDGADRAWITMALLTSVFAF